MSTSVEKQGKANKEGVVKRLVQVLFQMVLFAVLLFVSAGQIKWTWAWIYLGTFVLIVTVNAFILPYDLIVERGKSKENVKKWDRVIMTLNIIPALGLLIVAGLDYRFSWSPMLPGWLPVVSLLIMIFANGLFTWAMISNHFFSTAVRIQFDRTHRVATSGPYKYIRHPGYVGFIVINLATPLVLGSLWALIPGIIMAILFIIRTALEDSTLREELEGYCEYAQKVRYRLIPGIW